MKFELYEIWTEDEFGYQDLVDTTQSLKEAREIAQAAVDLGNLYVTIYRETEDGELEVVEEM